MHVYLFGKTFDARACLDCDVQTDKFRVIVDHFLMRKVN